MTLTQIGIIHTPHTLLGKTWDHVQIPPKLDQHIEEETTKFLAQ